MNASPASSAPFFDEFREKWGRLPDKTLFALLLACWLALFEVFGLSAPSVYWGSSLFRWLWYAYGNPVFDSAHGKIVWLAIIVLLWHKRDRLLANLSGPRWPALAVLAVALMVHLVGSLAQQQRLSAVGLFLGFYSLVGLAWGWNAMVEAFFPFFLFVFCVPLGSFMDNITLGLRVIAASLTEFVAHVILGVPLVRQGTTLLKPDGSAFEIVAGCSGLHSFTALLAVTTIYAMIVLRKPWKRALIIILTIPLAVVCNVARLVGMVVADRAWGSAAGAFVHDSDWILTYGIAIVSIMALGKWLREEGAVLMP